MVSFQPQRKPNLREIKQLHNPNNQRVVNPVILSAISLELDLHRDVSVQPAGLRSRSLHVEGAAVIGEQVVFTGSFSVRRHNKIR
jgi:hypothetical protein